MVRGCNVEGFLPVPIMIDYSKTQGQMIWVDDKCVWWAHSGKAFLCNVLYLWIPFSELLIKPQSQSMQRPLKSKVIFSYPVSFKTNLGYRRLCLRKKSKKESALGRHASIFVILSQCGREHSRWQLLSLPPCAPIASCQRNQSVHRLY